MEEKKVPALRFRGFDNAWEQRRLDDICEIVTKQTGFDYSATIKPSLVKECLDDTYPFIQNKDFCGDSINMNTDFFVPISIAEKFTKILLDKPSILISISGRIGNVGFYNINRKALIGGAVGICKLKNPENGDFIIQELESVYGQKYFQALTKASSHSNITVEDIRNIRIIFPKNKREIKKISELFKSLDHLISLHQRKLEMLKKVKKSMLEKMFPKNDAKVPEVRFSDFTDAWEQHKVRDLTNVLSASRVHKSEWMEKGVPFFRSSDVVAAYKGIENEMAYISHELFEELANLSGRLEKDDLLITGGGSIGVPYIVPDNKPLYSKDADLIWVKHSEKFASEYLYTYFICQRFRNYIGSISHVGTIAHYTIEQVKNTPVLMPYIDEQREIGSFFSSLNHLISLHQRKLEKLKNIKKSMLEKMFII